MRGKSKRVGIIHYQLQFIISRIVVTRFYRFLIKVCRVENLGIERTVIIVREVRIKKISR